MAFEGTLRPFQVEARDQLLEWGRGLLAVTMGGGKTPIMIAVLEELLDREEVECGLIITPASLKRQWNGTRGFPMFAPNANVVVIDGDADQRREQYARARHWAEYIVLGYSQISDDWNEVKKLPIDFIVMDEVQAIKNPGSQRSQRMEKLLRRARKKGNPIFGLTGQPMENKPEDVYHICAGIDPDVLGHPQIFDMTFIVRNKYGKAVRYPNQGLLYKTLVESIMVRVDREEIEEFLPEREREQYLVPFDGPTFDLYRVVIRDLHAALEEQQVTKSFDLAAHYGGNGLSPSEAAARGKIMSRLTCARMLCDHPMLLAMSADLYDATASGEMGALKAGSAYASELKERGLLDALPRGRGPKMGAVVADIRAILAEDPANKVVLFSTFKPTLSWLETALKRTTQCVIYHGGITTKKREEIREQFNNDAATRVFLSSDAGGAGVDLPAGNHLINYDLPFSAGQLEQRNARIDRMSSTHADTLIMDYLMDGSVEEFYADIVDARQETARAGIDGRGKRSISLPTASLKGFCKDWLDAHPPRDP
ncbi:MAG: DEAD/DEAH box helicase [Intrasporangiaceae bacterium]|nr:DEAD/DEAH box helicase [Intrasporangiaceae bacterium]